MTQPRTAADWWGVEHECNGVWRVFPTLHWADEPEKGAGPRVAFHCDACGKRYAFHEAEAASPSAGLRVSIEQVSDALNSELDDTEGGNDLVAAVLTRLEQARAALAPAQGGEPGWTGIANGTHEPAVDDFGNQYLVRVPASPPLTVERLADELAMHRYGEDTEGVHGEWCACDEWNSNGKVPWQEHAAAAILAELEGEDA